MGARNIKKLGGQFMNGVSYMTGAGLKATRRTVQIAKDRTYVAKKARMHSTLESVATQTKSPMKVSYLNKKGNAEITYAVNPHIKNTPIDTPQSKPIKTGTTYRANLSVKSPKSQGKKS